MKTKKERLAEFHSNMVNDPFMPANAEEANTFLRKHMDAVEKAALPPEWQQNYTYRMMIPSFNIEGAWIKDSSKSIWKAFSHVIEIYDCGKINIKTNDGQPWFASYQNA